MRIIATVCGILAFIAIAGKAASGSEELVQVAQTRAGTAGMRSNQPLLGYLLKPSNSGPHAAIVILHGCEGFGLTYVILGRELQSEGYSVLVLDSLGEANACEGGDGALAEAFDAYAALGWLVKQPFVDLARVGVLGFSMGGSAALMAGERGPLASTFPEHFRAAAAYYPHCGRSSGVMAVPTLILIGGGDDWAPAGDCEAMMKRREDNGAPVTLHVFPGATHAFNSPTPPHYYLKHFMQFDPSATVAARNQMLDFFHDQLNHSPSGHPPIPQ